ncbi:cytochrome P450 [Stereum hirsutum FP-91666 SS1]|uniref:cytochrome P450 n=1 Tax=Stereum hirsutum (strain FP-91666) TaxID=721885 RepID=UPI000444987F|nr:cytochrome P450 [Stereum hirsutum FP-91666 SS1]EIM85529.1 cytochrome P450 [Stereum hirsutum FP-91666 SS1]
MTFFLVLDVLLAVVGVYLVKNIISRPSTAPYPPGPKGLPLVGNALDMPTSQEWKTYAQWGNRWGGLVYINVLGQPFIIVNSLQTAIEMLDKKSSIYSDRPFFRFSSEIVGWLNTLALTPYGDRFRDYRRMLHSVIGTRMGIGNFHIVEEQETHRFLRRVLQTPDEISGHIRWAAGAIILRISHGYPVKDNEDPFITNADIAVDQFSKSAKPGAFLVDFISWLKYVPEWFPGTQWKQVAKAWKKDLSTMADEPHDFVKNQMASGAALPSFTATQLERHLTPEQEFNVKWAAASLYSGGADTTVSSIYSFFLAMTLHPDARNRAQAEIDAVVGRDRLPTFADREHLPYTEALVQEVFRWQPVVPMGLPHRLIQDDVQEGYIIRKGTVVFTNIWKFLHDEETYPDPMSFDPERFLGPKPQMDPRTVCFGFGRRICPGLNLADASVFISCAMTLAVFDITKAVENGDVVEPEVEYTSGTISHPKPFKCSIKPRSEKAVTLILSDGLFGDV